MSVFETKGCAPLCAQPWIQDHDEDEKFCTFFAWIYYLEATIGGLRSLLVFSYCKTIIFYCDMKRKQAKWGQEMLAHSVDDVLVGVVKTH